MTTHEFRSKIEQANPNQIPEKQTLLEALDSLEKDLLERLIPIGQIQVDEGLFGKICFLCEQTPIQGATCRFIRLTGDDMSIDINEVISKQQ